VTDNLALTLGDLDLDAVQRAIDAAVAAFPDGTVVAARSAEALTGLDGARVPAQHAHRIAIKRRELVRVLRLAAGVQVRARVTQDRLAPGSATGLVIEADSGAACAIDVTPELPAGWSFDGDRLSVAADAPPSDPYPVTFDPLVPALPALSLRLTVAGAVADCRLPFEIPPQVGPATTARLTPAAALVNLALPANAVSVRVSDVQPVAAAPAFYLPEGWRQVWTDGAAQIIPPADPAGGLIEAPLLLDGRTAFTEQRVEYDHVAPRLRAVPAVLRIRAAQVALPDVRVGYVGIGNDTVLGWRFYRVWTSFDMDFLRNKKHATNRNWHWALDQYVSPKNSIKSCQKYMKVV
jgi:hypothetical protein